MQLETSLVIAISGGIVAVVTNAFAIGVVYGKLTSKVDKTTADLAGVKKILEDNIAGVKKTFEDEIAEINAKFSTPEGEPRLMSYKAHDHICLRANEILTAELRHVSEALATHSKAVERCGSQVGELTVAVAVLEEKVEKSEKSEAKEGP